MPTITYRIKLAESTAPVPEASAVYLDGQPVAFDANNMADVLLPREPAGTKRRVYLYVAGNRGSTIEVTIYKKDAGVLTEVYARKLTVRNDPDVDAAEYFPEP